VETRTVGNVSLTFEGEIRDFTSGGKSGKAEIVQLESTDGLKAEVSIQIFDDGEIHIRLTEFLSPPPPKYSHLNRNGTMTVQTREHDGKRVALVRALRPGGKSHATLNTVSMSELTELLGSDAKEWMSQLGLEVGTWSEINPKAGKFKDSIAVAVTPSEMNLLVLPWTLTRVIALMKNLGKSVVDLA
jgi:hypothetical protein